jgi:hypothetical protein
MTNNKEIPLNETPPAPPDKCVDAIPSGRSPELDAVCIKIKNKLKGN